MLLITKPRDLRDLPRTRKARQGIKISNCRREGTDVQLWHSQALMGKLNVTVVVFSNLCEGSRLFTEADPAIPQPLPHESMIVERQHFLPALCFESGIECHQSALFSGGQETTRPLFSDFSSCRHALEHGWCYTTHSPLSPDAYSSSALEL